VPVPGDESPLVIAKTLGIIRADPRQWDTLARNPRRTVEPQAAE
jgi:hypothetical protein